MFCFEGFTDMKWNNYLPLSCQANFIFMSEDTVTSVPDSKWYWCLYSWKSLKNPSSVCLWKPACSSVGPCLCVESDSETELPICVPVVREGSRVLPVKRFGKKSRKENNGNKQIEEESVVRKSVRQQPEDGRGQRSGGEQRTMEGKLEGRARIRKT